MSENLKPPQPPHWADKLLEWLCPDELLEEIQGDLQELFEERVEEAGEKRARKEYILAVLGYLRPWAFKRNTNYQTTPRYIDMIRNYCTVAFRNLLKYKTYSLLNISGLAVGLATAILLLLWIQDEYSYDRFHSNYSRIYQVLQNQPFNQGETGTFLSVPPPLAAALKKEIPEVSHASRLSWGESLLFTYKDKNMIESGLYVDPDFLTIFSFPLLKGSLQNALTEPNTILITQQMAGRYFGNEDPVGKMIQVSQQRGCKVIGILRDLPRNSSLRFDWLMPIKDYMPEEDVWDNSNIRTAVLLHEGASAQQVNAKIEKFVGAHTSPDDSRTLLLHALEDWYLRYDFKNGQYTGGGRIVYVRIFSVVAVFVLVIACINFMNLSTASSSVRAKEVGVRKVIGASKGALISQFLGESLLLTLLSGLLAIGLVAIVLPVCNTWLNKELIIQWSNPWYLAGYAFILLLTGVLAGFYPALVLSAFQPVKVLKGLRNSAMGGAVWLRQSLVVLQFAVSALLITGTLVIYLQVNFLRNKNLGYNKDNLVWFDVENLTQNRYESAIAQFSKVPGVRSVTVTNTVMDGPWNRESGFVWKGNPEENRAMFALLNGDHHLLTTLGLELIAGRNFSTEIRTDTVNFIINEEAARRMGLTDPVGHPLSKGKLKGNIIGVVKDFHLSSLYVPIEPTIIIYRPRQSNIMFAKIDGEGVSRTVNELEKVYQSLLPGYPFNYHFADQTYDQLYRNEIKMGQLAHVFTGLAIFISCLGLFGLVSFTVARRTKEIGIRKVLGASIGHIFTLISKEFLFLVMIAFVLSCPVAWYVMHNWLENFSYKVDIAAWIFALAGGIAVIIALATISFQTIKAALTNPVNSLRNE